MREDEQRAWKAAIAIERLDTGQRRWSVYGRKRWIPLRIKGSVLPNTFHTSERTTKGTLQHDSGDPRVRTRLRRAQA